MKADRNVLAVVLPCLAAGFIVAYGGGAEASRVRCGGSQPRMEETGRLGSVSAPHEGGLPPEVVKQVIRAALPAFRGCYEAGLRPCPNLSGRVEVAFTVQPDGKVSEARDDGSEGLDGAVVRCVVAKVRELRFPSFEGPSLRVRYPISFAPGT